MALSICVLVFVNVNPDSDIHSFTELTERNDWFSWGWYVMFLSDRTDHCKLVSGEERVN